MALEAALVEAGRVSTDAIDAFVEHIEHRHGTAPRRPGGRPGVGRSRLQGAPARRRHGGDGRARHRRRRGRQRAGRREHRGRCTTSSSARCAPATRGRCSGSHRSGTRASPTGPGPSPSRGPCSREFGHRARPTTSRCGCGTPARRSATSCSPRAPPAPRPSSEERACRARLARRHDRRPPRRQPAAEPAHAAVRNACRARSAGSGPRPSAGEVVPAAQPGPVGFVRSGLVVEERVRQQHVELHVVAVEHPDPPRVGARPRAVQLGVPARRRGRGRRHRVTAARWSPMHRCR